MIRYIIIDDEPIAHTIIEKFAMDISLLELKGNCYNAMQAMDLLKKEKIDLMFLDINMPKLKGLDFLKLLSNPPATIITSAYEEYALQGYELNVIDYLLKPFSFERFMKAVYKVNNDQVVSAIQQPENFTDDQSSFFIKGDKTYHHIRLKDILFIESIGSYCKVHTSDKAIVTHEKISAFTKRLEDHDFFRIHKSYIVAKQHIRSIEGNRIFINEHAIPVGQTYKVNLRKIIDG